MKTHRFKQREVRPVKDERIPSTWMFTDTETGVREVDGEQRHFFHIGWIFLCLPSWEEDGKKVTTKYFDDAGKYLEYIEEKTLEHGDVVLCGHNIFFDLQAAGFFPYFAQAGWSLEYIYDKGLTFILRVSYPGASLTILSTTNWFDCSLRDLGDMISLRKGDVDFDNVTPAALKKYCYRDTEIVMTAMKFYLSFIRENGLGKFCYTRASQSLVAYRKRFMMSRVYVHDDQNIHDLEREAYKGGRTEAFFIGKLPVSDYVTLDVNGMYPYVMKKYKYPVKLVGYLEDEPAERYTELLGGFLMIAEVEVDTDEPVYAVRYKGKTIFPTGCFTTVLCTGALLYGIERNHIKRFIRASVYLEEDIFSRYVDFFQNLREGYKRDNKEVMQKFCKYMHNSLYGKWGEKKVVTESYEAAGENEYSRQEVYDMVRGGTWIETVLFGTQVFQHYEGETAHSVPAIAAHITEYARLTLWDYIRKIGRDNVLYCDTDSLIIDARYLEMARDLLDDSEQGMLKIQDRYSSLTIDGAKNYRTDAVRHIKGIPSDAKEVAPGVFEYIHFKSMCMCLRERTKEGVSVETVQRRLVSKYDKGVVTSSGAVKPLHFGSPDQLF